MIKRYTIKDFPQIKEVISISDLAKLKAENGFLVFIVNSLNTDELNDYVEMIGALKLPIVSVVSHHDMDVYEVCDKLQKEAEIKDEI